MRRTRSTTRATRVATRTDLKPWQRCSNGRRTTATGWCSCSRDTRRTWTGSCTATRGSPPGSACGSVSPPTRPVSWPGLPGSSPSRPGTPSNRARCLCWKNSSAVPSRRGASTNWATGASHGRCSSAPARPGTCGSRFSARTRVRRTLPPCRPPTCAARSSTWAGRQTPGPPELLSLIAPSVIRKCPIANWHAQELALRSWSAQFRGGQVLQRGDQGVRVRTRVPDHVHERVQHRVAVLAPVEQALRRLPQLGRVAPPEPVGERQVTVDVQLTGVPSARLLVIRRQQRAPVPLLSGVQRGQVDAVVPSPEHWEGERPPRQCLQVVVGQQPGYQLRVQSERGRIAVDLRKRA